MSRIGQAAKEIFVQRSIAEQARGMKTMSSVKKRCEGCKVRFAVPLCTLNSLCFWNGELAGYG